MKNKVKTKKAAAKRYFVLSSGRVKVFKANKRHNTGLKSRSLTLKLNKPKMVHKHNESKVRKCLPNSKVVI